MSGLTLTVVLIGNLRLNHRCAEPPFAARPSPEDDELGVLASAATIMTLYSDPPLLRPFSEDKPTLLVCWWTTIFCAVIILLRVSGRFVRTEKLFPEDKTAALALVPLFLRMGCVHVILIYGTNNAQLADANLSDDELRRKSIASGLVLLSRILYAATYVATCFFNSQFSLPTWRQQANLRLAGIDYGSSSSPSWSSSGASTSHGKDHMMYP